MNWIRSKWRAFMQWRIVAINRVQTARGKVYSTKGWIDREMVQFMPSTLCDDGDKLVVRTDKYLRSTGEWIGNDLHVEIRKGLPIFGEQFKFGGS